MTRLKKQITHRGSPKACGFTHAHALSHAQDTHKLLTVLAHTHYEKKKSVLISLLQHI